MLQLDEVTVRFGATTAVDDVTLSLDEGQVLAVLGPSGCGKSTLLRAVAGLERLDAGSVRWRERDLRGVPTHERGFALMFQDGQLFAHASVADNIGYALRLRRLGVAERRRRVDELLELVGLPGYGARRPATLSGGEQQRVALARSLAADPGLLLLDEPLSALDRSLRERLAGDLREILVTTGTTAVLVTHDHDEAFTIADRMAVMLAGQVVQEGTTAEVWRAPATREVAEFIGFETFLTGAAADTVSPPARRVGAVSPADRRVGTDAPAGPPGRIDGSAGTDRRVLALRRAALRVDPSGRLEGVVRRAVAVSDAVHLTVDVDGVGEVAALGDDPGHHLEGRRVRLALDPRGTAYLPG
ncbi:ABC transporter ATP-binding protein [Ornithinimicrobium cerasi]|uniref:ABC-type quaternary amine transporter n=1 Tax=Ornithinimicrobium cerasi TaxID=2248773 RepID=A0A285VTG8_9MICO|nr:ABC transporter ATP-binding protein [Ornithinimicrobium cerasi]SOC56878.1 thiamine transport system ATP-binding protein [Ornithinimicrobium cerasi]